MAKPTFPCVSSHCDAQNALGAGGCDLKNVRVHHLETHELGRHHTSSGSKNDEQLECSSALSKPTKNGNNFNITSSCQVSYSNDHGILQPVTSDLLKNPRTKLLSLSKAQHNLNIMKNILSKTKPNFVHLVQHQTFSRQGTAG